MPNKDYNKPNSFIIYRNRYKVKHEQPDMKGSFTDENGIVYEVSGWVNQDGKGNMTSISGKLVTMADKNRIRMQLKAQNGDNNIEKTELDLNNKKKNKAVKKKPEDFKKPEYKDTDAGLPL